MTSKIISLHGRSSSIVLEREGDNLPIWRHFGSRLSTAPDISSWQDVTPEASFSLNENQPFRTIPLFGHGWFNTPALSAHRNGLDWAHEISDCKINATAKKLEIVCLDNVAQIELTQTIQLVPEFDVYSFQTSVKNLSSDTLNINRLMAGSIPIHTDFNRVKSFSGRHNNEFVPVSNELTRSNWQRVNRRGLTSHDCPPYARVVTPATNGFSGDIFAGHLAWSGNHEQLIEWCDYGFHIWQCGAWYAPGEIRLNKDEILSSPNWIVSFSKDGENGIAQNLINHMRSISPLWESGQLSQRPVHLNTWEGLYFDHNEQELMELASAAADLGVERFIVDDGWFAGRHDDTTSLGDWWADIDKYPNGLAPIANHVKGLGMEFGLWVEPEMVNPKSQLFERHPEWALQLPQRTPLESRNQLVLDMTNEGVQQYLFEKLSNLLSTLPIDYLKWDHNRDLTQAGSDGFAIYTNQIYAIYTLFQKIRAAFPNVEIEACAGGGGRIDAGILQLSHRVWASDCIDAVSRERIQCGFLQYLPPEIMGTHIGASPAHSTGRSQNIDFRAAIAIIGHFGIELDPRKIPAPENEKIKTWVNLYKNIRNITHTGQVWRGDASDNVTWQVLGNENEFYGFIFRMQPTEQRFPPSVRFPMLNPKTRYFVERVDPQKGQFDGYTGKEFLLLDSHGKLYPGEVLDKIGIALPFMKAERCIVLKFSAVSE